MRKEREEINAERKWGTKERKRLFPRECVVWKILFSCFIKQDQENFLKYISILSTESNDQINIVC